MNDLQLFDEQSMTVKEVAEVLGRDQRTVQLKVKELFPEIVVNGKTTYLNETQVTAVKMDLEKRFEVKTDLEKRLIVKQAMELLIQDVQDLQEENTGLKQKVVEMQPAADFYKSVTDSKDAIEMSKVAKVLDMGIGRTKLFAFLRNAGILRHNNEPYQTYIDRGYFRVIEQKFAIASGETRINIKTLVYQKGLDYIRKMLIQRRAV